MVTNSVAEGQTDNVADDSGTSFLPSWCIGLWWLLSGWGDG
jgi:hypothetical protein